MNGTMSPNLAGYRFHQLLDTGEVGGGNLLALAIAGRLRAGGLASAVWSDTGPAIAAAGAAGLAVHSFDQARLRAAGRLRGRWREWRLGRRLARHGPGLAHVSSAFLYGLVAQPLLASGLKRVAHVQIESPIADWQWAFRRPPDLIVTCAQFLAAAVRPSLPGPVRDSARIVAVPNAVDTARYAPGDRAAAKGAVGAPPNRPLLLMLANLAPHKGQMTAVEAVARLRARGIDVECWLAGVERGGESAFAEKLSERIAALGVADRVRLLGQRSDVPDLLRAADAFLLPSTNEGLPLSILEAQSVGVPVVAAPTAGVPEIVTDGVTGFLVAADDADGYAGRLAQILSDPGLARSLATAGREQVKRRHEWSAYMAKIMDVYAEVLEER